MLYEGRGLSCFLLFSRVVVGNFVCVVLVLDLVVMVIVVVVIVIVISALRR